MLLFLCVSFILRFMFSLFFFFQAEDGIRYLVRSRGLGDVYKSQEVIRVRRIAHDTAHQRDRAVGRLGHRRDGQRLTLSLIHI